MSKSLSCSSLENCVMQNAFVFWQESTSHRFESPDVYVPVIINDNIQGTLDFIAAAPPDFKLSYSGSALPFANCNQALANTPNTGRLYCVKQGEEMRIPLLYPNSFYVGSSLVHPSVFLRYVNNDNNEVIHVAIKLGKSLPRKTLYPSLVWCDKTNRNAMSQEKILYESAILDYKFP